VSPAAPVFVDDTGRRRTLTRRAVRILVIGFAGYLGLLVAGFARDPHLGALGLPTFGLPGLVHSDPPPTVLGESTSRTPAGAATTGVDPAAEPVAARPAGAGSGGRAAKPVTAAPTPGRGTTTPTTAVPPSSGGAGGATPPSGAAAAPTTTTTAPAGGHGKGTTTTSTSPTSTSTTTVPGQNPGQGSSSGTTSGKGPDGSGPPGQTRRPTTTTTAGTAG
jgi:hypothetical protein